MASDDPTERLRAHCRQLEQALDMCGIGSVLWNLATNAVALSATARRIYGFGDDHVVTVDDVAGAVHADDATRSMEAVQAALSGTPSTFEVRLVRPSGEWCWSRSHLALDETGGVLIGTVEDLTDERSAASNAREFVARASERQRLETVGRVAAGVAHDFNNSLCVISALTDLSLLNIEAGASSRELVHDLESMAECVDAASRVTRQLLAVSRRQVVSPAPLELDGTAANALDLVRSLLPETVELKFDPGAGDARIHFDRGNFEQIVLNLCINAGDAMDEDGTIEVSTEVVDGAERLRLRIADDGCGMSPQTLERAFDPFFTTKEPEGGSGLGLWSVDNIVRAGGATIEAISTENIGTVFVIEFPRTHLRTAPSGQTTATVPRGGETLLLAEDDLALRTVLNRALEAQGYEIVTAPNAAAAIAAAGAMPRLDLLVTDIVMPGRDGTQLFRTLCASHPELRVLFMSGYTERSREQLDVLETAPLLPKPFTIRRFLRRVRATLDA